MEPFGFRLLFASRLRGFQEVAGFKALGSCFFLGSGPFSCRSGLAFNKHTLSKTLPAQQQDIRLHHDYDSCHV